MRPIDWAAAIVVASLIWMAVAFTGDRGSQLFETRDIREAPAELGNWP